MAVFTDGFQFHCHPNNRIADDLRKRRAILESGSYHVWSVTWDDLEPGALEQNMVCHARVAEWTEKYAKTMRAERRVMPDVTRCMRTGSSS